MTIAVDLGRKATLQTNKQNKQTFANSEDPDEMPHGKGISSGSHCNVKTESISRENLKYNIIWLL